MPTPGKNRRQYVFGAMDIKSGRVFWHVQDTNNQWGCMVLVQQLAGWARTLRTRVILVWDNAGTHTAKRLAKFLNQPHVRRWVKVFWLSTYSPDLNDIERLWRYLKATGMANHLFRTLAEFRRHLLKVLREINTGPSEATGIVFDGWGKVA